MHIFFPIPSLATQANAFFVDDASTGSTASWVLSHGCSFFLAGLAIGSSVICNVSVIKLHGWIS